MLQECDANAMSLSLTAAWSIWPLASSWSSAASRSSSPSACKITLHIPHSTRRGCRRPGYASCAPLRQAGRHAHSWTLGSRGRSCKPARREERSSRAENCCATLAGRMKHGFADMGIVTLQEGGNRRRLPHPLWRRDGRPGVPDPAAGGQVRVFHVLVLGARCL